MRFVPAARSRSSKNRPRSVSVDCLTINRIARWIARDLRLIRGNESEGSHVESLKVKKNLPFPRSRAFFSSLPTKWTEMIKTQLIRGGELSSFNTTYISLAF